MNKILGLIILLLVFIFGFGISQIYNQPNDGCKGIHKRIQSGDTKGNWVCVNVKDMTFERAVQVCQHEVGHEIFAEMCEKNITKCFDEVDELR